jgi:integrase
MPLTDVEVRKSRGGPKPYKLGDGEPSQSRRERVAQPLTRDRALSRHTRHATSYEIDRFDLRPNERVDRREAVGVQLRRGVLGHPKGANDDAYIGCGLRRAEIVTIKVEDFELWEEQGIRDPRRSNYNCAPPEAITEL